MAVEVRPATSFADVCTMLGPRSRSSTNCFCLSYRIPHALNAAMRGEARFDFVEHMMSDAEVPIGVLAYDGDDVVGWAAIAPRREMTYPRSRTIPQLDKLDVWSLWCLRTRPGHRRTGSADLIAGALRFAFEHGAPAVEAYPIDNETGLRRRRRDLLTHHGEPARHRPRIPHHGGPESISAVRRRR